MRSELRARLLIVGVDPTAVTDALSLEPGFAWNRGDDVPGAPLRKRSQDVWGIESRVAAESPLDAHVADLFTQLGAKTTLLAAIPEASAKVVVAVWSIGGDRPDLVLAPASVQLLASIGAEFSIDLYVVRTLGARSTRGGIKSTE